MAQRRLLLVGDFIRLHYQPRVAELLAQSESGGGSGGGGTDRIEVVGPAASTGDSRSLAAGIEGWLKEFRPDAVHFNAGLDDLCYVPSERRPRVGIAEYRLNLQRVVDAMRPIVGGDIVFATSTPIRHTSGGSSGHGRQNSNIEEYNIAACEVMLADDILINHLDRVVERDPDHLLGPDGMGLAPAGIAAIASEVVHCVQGLWH